jgi:hypothetical protein
MWIIKSAANKRMQSDAAKAAPLIWALGDKETDNHILAICTNNGTLQKCQRIGPFLYFSFNSFPDENRYENG